MAESRAKALFIEALDVPVAQRERFLLERCGDDTALRHEVQSLLAFHDEESLHEWKADADASVSRAFRAGEIFADRYRMVSRIGRGGMGDVWRVDDLTLHTQVALKLMFPLSGQSRNSVLNEVRLARQITDPAICRVFDVGESDGQLFFTMELVEGEDLAALLKRVGRVPAEKVIDIGRQLCNGLTTAHARGVLHRDLKPANVLIDRNGRVRITDFGIAIAIARGSTSPVMFVGTPGYMAPEQMSPGMPLTEKTDIYALGLLLYELASGQRPFENADANGQPRPLDELTLGISPALDAVVRSALNKKASERPASAADMSERLGKAALMPGRRPSGPWTGAAASARVRRLAIAAAVVALLLAVAVVARRSLSVPSAALTERDTIVLADFENTTGETVFDGTLALALAVTLEQSPFLQVFPDERVRESLRLMQRSPDERLTRVLAREVARREQSKALLAGSIARLGNHYVIALEAVNAETGDSMARQQVEAESREQVLTALGTAATQMREKLGESLASVQRFDVPLPRATTPSLDALHAYALALPEGRMAATLDAIPSLKRAIELDPQFALAYASLSGVLSNTDQPGLAPEYAKRAFELRDRVSERERFIISWRYYRDATFDTERQLELTRMWTATYPRESLAFNSLGLAYNIAGQYERALEGYREAMRLDPKFFAPYGNIAEAQLALNNLDEARAMLRQAESLGIKGPAIRRVSFMVAFMAGDTADMARQIELATAVPESNANTWRARALAFGGEIAAAHDVFRRAIVVARERGLNESAAQLMVEDAEAHAIVQQCGQAGQETTAALALSHDAFTLQRSIRTRALCGDRGGLQALIGELNQRFPDATLAHHAMIPVARAALLLRDGDAGQALPLLEDAVPYDRTQHAELWPWYLRGLAYLQLNAGRSAAEQFQQLIDHRGVRVTSPLYPLAHLGAARAAQLNGDKTTAAAMYDRFLSFWKAADEGLSVVAQARRERARVLP